MFARESIWPPVLGFSAATFALAVLLLATLAWRFDHVKRAEAELLAAHDRSMMAATSGTDTAGGDAGRLAPAEDAGGQALSAPEISEHIGSDLDSALQASLVAVGLFSLLGVLVFAYQMRQRRKAEQRALTAQQLEQSERFDLLATMAAGTAHDFNNILTVISGNAALVRFGLAEGSPLREYVAEVESSVERAANLTRQLRAYTGTGDEPRTVMDLNELVADSANMMQALAPETIELNVSVAESLPPVRAAPEQSRQILLNLVKNSVDELGSSPGRIDVRTEEMVLPRSFPDAYVIGRDAKPGRYAAITVTDTGGGVPAPDIEAIFSPYVSSKGLGRGLGLASVAGIVKNHDGVIAVKSDAHGTSFTVLLPSLQQEQEDEPANRHLSALSTHAGDNST